MTYNLEHAAILRRALHGLPGLTEQPMFGGLCFLSNGHMVAGLHKGGAMIRIGQDGHAEALRQPGVGQMLFTGRAMVGMIDISPELLADPARLLPLLQTAAAFVAALPSKKPAKTRAKPAR